VANEYRRDGAPLRQNDQAGVGFVTLYDRRSGFMFHASPLGASCHRSIIDEGPPAAAGIRPGTCALDASTAAGRWR